jgi:PIN domain nuclease of toxin-antitoxin system
MPGAIATSGVLVLPISLADATRVAELPKHHRDPFDRLLVAQAQLNRLVLASTDRALEAYDVEVLAR